MIKYITSPENKIYKETKKLLMRSQRMKQGLFIAEGERIVRDALESNCVEYVIINDKYDKIESEMQTEIPVYKLTDKLFESISDTKTTQGIAAVCRINKPQNDDIKGEMLMICDGVSDPGNIGTIIRTAECAGASGVILMGNCADPYNPKTVRSTMGSIFRIPIYDFETDDLSRLTEYDIVAAMLKNSDDLYDMSFGKKTAVIVGNEAHGVSDAVAQYAGRRVRIPMKDGAESLNAAVAAGLIMYEVYRQALRRME